MPILLYLPVIGFAAFGLYQSPTWLRKVFFAIIGLLVVCLVAGFVWQLLRSFFFGVSNGSPNEGVAKQHHSSGTQQVNSSIPEAPPPPTRDKVSIQKDNERLQLLEDDFLK